jgi:hypothetical protein
MRPSAEVVVTDRTDQQGLVSQAAGMNGEIQWSAP